MSDEPEPTNITNRSGGSDIEAARDTNIGGDVVGRDKVTHEEKIETGGGASIGGNATLGDSAKFVGRDNTESAGGHLIHAEAGATVIVGERPASAPPQDVSPAPGEPPFKGLQYFDVADADLFFGRELLTAKLVGLLREQRFLAVVGASGSGKSSVVRAGLISALTRGDQFADGTQPPAGSSRWPVYIITPTTHPLEALAASLTQDSESVTATTTLIDDLARDPRGLHLAVRRVLSRMSADHLLLVVDQFEELFTQCRNDIERKAFVDNLITAAASETAGPTIVVITLRADFYPHCGQFENLRAALEQWQVYIGPMNTDELRCAIEEPAKRGGWEFEAGLVDLMLRDVGNEPGALPLLSHALLETWKRRRGRTLTLAGYGEAGGVHGAIAKTAESVFNQLKPEQQTIAHNIFVRLTELGEGTQDTRRRAALSELVTQPIDGQAIEVVLKTLIDARLAIIEKDTVEVAHEALIHEWPRLREWLDEDRDGLRVQRKLNNDARDWVALQRDPGALYRGARLGTAIEWAKDHANQMNTLEKEFLEVSRTQQVNELEVAKRQAARLRRRAVYLTGAFGLSLLLALAAVFLGIQAAQQSQLSRSRELAAIAISQIDRNPERSILIALEAINSGHNLEAENALRSALLVSRIVATLRGHEDLVINAQFAPDGQRIVTASYDGTARVWEAATGKELATLRGHEGRVSNAQFAPDGQRIVTAGDDGTARVWDAATGKELATLRGHEGRVYSAQFAPDGQRIVTAGQDGTARVWEAATGKELITFRGHEGAVYDAQFAPDGQRIVTAGDDGTARVWEAATGKELATLRGHEDLVINAQFAPDGQRIVTAGYDGTARVWEAATGRELATLRGHEGRVYSAQFAPDGQRIVTAGLDGTARVWEAATGKELATLRGHEGRVSNAQFAPDGQRIVTAGDDSTARVWEAATGKELATLRGHEGAVYDAQFAPDGQRIVTASQDGVARVWEAATDKELATLRGHEGAVSNAQFAPDGQRIVTAGDDGTARVWEAATGKELATLRGHEGAVYDAQFAPNGQWIVTAGLDGTARVWEAATGRELATLRGHEGAIANAQFAPDGQRIVTAGQDGTARVWKAATGKELVTLRGHEGAVYNAQFAPDGQRIVTAGQDGTARVWEAATGKELATLRGHEGAVYNAQFAPDGQRIVTAGDDGTARVWDAATGKELATLRGHEGRVSNAQFAPDGQWIVTAGEDNTVRVWEAATGRELATLRGHEGRVSNTQYALDGQVSNAQFAPDGQWIVTAGYDGTARVWEAATGRELATLRGHQGAVYNAQFAPDGQRIVTAGEDGTVRVYVVQLNDLIALAKTRVGRELTCDERRMYLHEDRVCATPTPVATAAP